jgi:hypothetical protein
MNGSADFVVVEKTKRNDLIGWNAWGCTRALLRPIEEESHANCSSSTQCEGGADEVIGGTRARCGAAAMRPYLCHCDGYLSKGFNGSQLYRAIQSASR